MTWNLQRSNTKLRKITPFIVLYICGVSCVHVHGGACAHICTCVYRPEVDVKCSPPLLPSTLFFEARSFTEPGIYWCSRAGQCSPNTTLRLQLCAFMGMLGIQSQALRLHSRLFIYWVISSPRLTFPHSVLWVGSCSVSYCPSISPLSWTRCSTQPVLILSSYFLLNLDFA